MSSFRKSFPGPAKPVVAMVHVPALPGTDEYDAALGVDGAVAKVKKDVATLLEAGVDSVLFCNEFDRPYTLEAQLAEITAMTRIVAECKPSGVPFGVDFLWDYRAALAIGASTGAHYVREVFSGSWESDMGPWTPDAAWTVRERRRLQRQDMGLWFNVTPEFASDIGRRSPAVIARSTAVSSKPDVILVSGGMAGDAVKPDTFAEIREAVRSVNKEIPVLVNTGATAGNIAGYLAQGADGVVVGTALKKPSQTGQTWNDIDPDRVREFLAAVRGA